MTFDLDGEQPSGRPGRGALWPDSETFTTDADGRSGSTGSSRASKTDRSASQFKDRPGFRLGDTGKILREIVDPKPGEVRDLGDVKVKARRAPQ